MTHPTDREGRALTPGEIALCRTVFADAIDYATVRLHRRTWWPLQPRNAVMAPDGSIWFHPRGDAWREDFAVAEHGLQALLVHEMAHVWQAQRRGRWYLPFARHAFCRYDYRLKPGKPFLHYGIEQQAEIVRHAWSARIHGRPIAALDALLPFENATQAA